MTDLLLPLLGAGLSGLVAAVLGLPLTLRDMGMYGFGLAHVGFAGVAVGLAAGVSPMATGVAVAVAAGLAVHGFRDGLGSDETALAGVTLGGFAGGLAVVGLFGVPKPEVTGVLFGSPLEASPGDVAAVGLLAALSLAGFAALYKEIFFATFSEEAASLAGVPADVVDAGLLAATAAVVVVGAKVAGLLLVGALVVLPPAAGIRWARTFRGAVWASAAAGLASALGGTALAAGLGIANGAPVVLAAFLVLGLAHGGARWAGR